MKRPGRLEITTKIGCKINCVYCPQKLLLGQYFKENSLRKSMLTYEDFRTCIDKLPVQTRIDFSGMAEPWLNSACTDMICYAVQTGHPVAIYTTLIGMKKEDFERIKDFELEEFVLHIPDAKSNSHIVIDDNYIQLLQEVINYKKDGSNLVTGYSCHGEIHPQIINAVPKDSKLITELIDRAGNLDSDYVESKENIGEIVCVNCEDDINHNVLLPDGTILLCCMDYGMKHVLGNLLMESYEEIQNSAEAQKVRRGLAGQEQDVLCRNCTNGRSVHELYDDFALYRDWSRKLIKNDESKAKDLEIYRQWVEKLEKQQEELKAEYSDWIRNLEEQKENGDRDLEIYRQWVAKLEQQKNSGDKDLAVYKQRVENLEIQQGKLKEEYENSKKFLDEQERENQKLEKELEEIRNWKGFHFLEKLNRKN